MTLEKEEQIDLLVLLGTYKSFSEQLYNMKGLHSGRVKQKFNLLHNYVRGYEKQIDSNWLNENRAVINQLSDAITELIYIVRESVGKEGEKVNN